MNAPHFVWLIAVPLLAAPLVYLIGHAGRGLARWVGLAGLLAAWVPFVLATRDLAAGAALTYTRRRDPTAPRRPEPAAGRGGAGARHAGHAVFGTVYVARNRTGKVLRHAVGDGRGDDRPWLRGRPVQPVAVVRGDGGHLVPAGGLLPRAALLARGGRQVPGPKLDRVGAGAAGHRAGAGGERHAEHCRDPGSGAALAAAAGSGRAVRHRLWRQDGAGAACTPGCPTRTRRPPAGSAPCCPVSSSRPGWWRCCARSRRWPP